ncbi:MAG: lipopolysaccharide transport periplasmic protein LptA, partial [Gammaproteobacteria bacterium]|nr:lipopolysaccharide transport periplasmic protein LptA [Gammaproteobacteria bacterium]
MTIDADEIGMDLKTGGRTFDGNVIAEQGSMRLEADKLVVETEDNELSKATAFGEPAIFRQRPEGKEQDVIGRAQQLEFDQVHDIVTLHQ